MVRTLVVGVGLVAIAIAPACKRKKKADEAGAAESAAGAPPAVPPSTSADVLIKQARDRVGASWLINDLKVDYVGSDGTMAPRYGALTMTFVSPPTPPTPPPDDPSRPTGAPVPPATVTPPECSEESWTINAGWTRQGRDSYGMAGIGCMSFGQPAAVRCTIAALWQRAIADGAPANALARIDLHNYSVDGGATWDFSIQDAPRGVDFSRSYPDDCPPMVEVPSAR